MLTNMSFATFKLLYQCTKPFNKSHQYWNKSKLIENVHLSLLFNFFKFKMKFIYPIIEKLKSTYNFILDKANFKLPRYFILREMITFTNSQGK